MSTTTTMEDFYGPVVDAYSRAQAIEDDVLVKVPYGIQTEVGIRFPVAITHTVWSECVTPPKTNRIESVEGRLWDLLWMFKLAARQSGGSEIQFVVRFGKRNVRLKGLCGPGDDTHPVITIMYPHED